MASAVFCSIEIVTIKVCRSLNTFRSLKKGMLATFLHALLRNLKLGNRIAFFVLGAFFSIVGIFLSLQVNVGFVALFVISVAALPVIYRTISLSELLAGRVSSDSKKGVLFED